MSGATLELRRLQSWFARAVIDAAGAKNVARRIAGTGPLAADARLGIYAHAFDARMYGVLANDFPGVQRLLGDAAFERLAAAYVRARPSRHPNLNQLGAAFPRFVRERCRARRASFAAEVAVLELAIARAYDAERSPALELDALAAAAARGRDVRLPLQPSVRLLTCRYPVARWYDAFEAGRDVRVPRAAPAWVCVHRSARGVHRTALDRDQFAVLARLARGAALERALARVRAGAPVERWFRTWAGAGLFAAP